MAKARDEDDEALRRLGGGRWQTRDERFTIEPQSGTWAVLDAEHTDELGLPLVRGPFRSLAAAKEAIATARQEAAPSSPLDRRRQTRANTTSDRPRKLTASEKSEKPTEPDEPRWFRDLKPDDRRRAARLIDRLTAAGAPDPEGMVRRDMVGDVPAIAAYAVERALEELGSEPSVADVADALAEGRDGDLGVRWRLVDGDGREIRLDLEDLRG